MFNYTCCWSAECLIRLVAVLNIHQLSIHHLRLWKIIQPIKQVLYSEDFQIIIQRKLSYLIFYSWNHVGRVQYMPFLSRGKIWYLLAVTWSFLIKIWYLLYTLCLYHSGELNWICRLQDHKCYTHITHITHATYHTLWPGLCCHLNLEKYQQYPNCTYNYKSLFYPTGTPNPKASHNDSSGKLSTKEYSQCRIKIIRWLCYE